MLKNEKSIQSNHCSFPISSYKFSLCAHFMGIVSSVLGDASARHVEGEVPLARTSAELAADLKSINRLYLALFHELCSFYFQRTFRCSKFPGKDQKTFHFESFLVKDGEVEQNLTSLLVEDPWKSRVRIRVMKVFLIYFDFFGPICSFFVV
jgi:hypothetical protein